MQELFQKAENKQELDCSVPTPKPHTFYLLNCTRGQILNDFALVQALLLLGSQALASGIFNENEWFDCLPGEQPMGLM